MKYNILNDYKIYLECYFIASTANTYYKAMDYLLKYKNQFSKYKNAFLKFCTFQNIFLSQEIQNQLQEMKQAKQKKYRQLKPVTVNELKNKIRGIKDKKLRLSYNIMINSGLRVFEVGQIKKEDCIVTKEDITLNFLGKGGNKECAVILKKDYAKFYDELSSLINKNLQGKKIFYSSSYLQKKANKMNLRCHDLRRAFAKLDYKKTKSLKHTQKAMRHKKSKNTKIYINSKVKI